MYPEIQGVKNKREARLFWYLTRIILPPRCLHSVGIAYCNSEYSTKIVVFFEKTKNMCFFLETLVIDQRQRVHVKKLKTAMFDHYRLN